MVDDAFEPGDADARATPDARDARDAGDAARDAVTSPDGARPDAAGPDAAVDGHVVRDATPIEPLPDAALPDATTLPEVCPPSPEPSRPCDPLAQTGCAAGDACIEFVQEDSSSSPACASYLWGSACTPAGTGKQWAPCNGAGCAAGYQCLGVRGVTVCLQFCDASGVGGCPAGLACDTLFVGSKSGVCE